MKYTQYFLIIASSFALVIFHPGNIFANKLEGKDTHYTPSGFFDIHVCNWPNRPLFYMGLYSTEKFNMVKSVKIFNADNIFIGELDLLKYRKIDRNNMPEKRVYISQIEALQTKNDGWFTAKIESLDGTIHTGKDFVIHYEMPIASKRIPTDKSEDIPPPTELKWNEVEEAAYYQVFIKDLWDGEKLIYTSKLLDKPVLKLPDSLIKTGGYYAWKIHARDVNEHIHLGDFNAGSLSEWAEFSVSE